MNKFVILLACAAVLGFATDTNAGWGSPGPQGPQGEEGPPGPQGPPGDIDLCTGDSCNPTLEGGTGYGGDASARSKANSRARANSRSNSSSRSRSSQDQEQYQGQIGINGQTADNTGNFSGNETNVNENVHIDSRDLKHHAETAARAAAGSFCSAAGISAQGGVFGGSVSTTSTVCMMLEVSRAASAMGNVELAGEALEDAYKMTKSRDSWIKRNILNRINPLVLLF